MYNGIVVYMPDIIKMALDRLDALPGSSNDESGYRTITYILQWLIEVSSDLRNIKSLDLRVGTLLSRFLSSQPDG